VQREGEQGIAEVVEVGRGDRRRRQEGYVAAPGTSVLEDCAESDAPRDAIPPEPGLIMVVVLWQTR